MKKFLKPSMLHLVTIVLLTLQLVGVINISFWAVFAPSILAISLIIVLGTVILVMMTKLIKSGKFDMDTFMRSRKDEPMDRVKQATEVVDESKEEDK